MIELTSKQVSEMCDTMEQIESISTACKYAIHSNYTKEMDIEKLANCMEAVIKLIQPTKDTLYNIYEEMSDKPIKIV